MDFKRRERESMNAINSFAKIAWLVEKIYKIRVNYPSTFRTFQTPPRMKAPPTIQAYLLSCIIHLFFSFFFSVFNGLSLSFKLEIL